MILDNVMLVELALKFPLSEFFIILVAVFQNQKYNWSNHLLLLFYMALKFKLIILFLFKISN